MRSEVERVVDEILRPLLEADGGGVTLVSVDEAKAPPEIVLYLHGSFRGCPSAPIVQAHVLEPALQKAAGCPIRVRLTPMPPASLTLP